MVDIRIEDIHYSLPTEQIAVEDYDREKWLQKNPIDYYKLLYILFTTTDNAPKDFPRDTAMAVAFQAIYHITRQYIPDTLYKYFSLTADQDLNDKKLQTLRKKQVYMSDIKDFNDPFDSKAFFYNPQALADIKRLEHVDGRFIDDFSAFHKGTALTENGTNSMPMWAHYANNHQGFCVAYDMKNPFNTALAGCTFPIQYTDQRLDITSYMKKYASGVATEIDKQMAQGKKPILLTDLSLVYVAQYLCNIKHLTWQYEKEFRCTNGANAKGMPFIDAAPKAIYVGLNCSKENRNKLIKISKELSVPIYQMCFDELSEHYELVEKLLDARI